MVSYYSRSVIAGSIFEARKAGAAHAVAVTASSTQGALRRS
jgi:hypothetical protein